MSGKNLCEYTGPVVMDIDFNTRAIPFSLQPLGLIDAFVRLGASVDELLRNTGLGEHSLHTKCQKISYIQQAEITRNGMRACAMPGLGLRVGQLLDWSFFGTLGGVVHSSPSLADAYSVFRRYMVVIQPWYKAIFPRTDYYLDKNHYIVSPLRPLQHPQLAPELARFELECRLAILLRLYDACGNKSVADLSVVVGLDYPSPDYAELFKQLPATRVKFNCGYAFIAVHQDFFMSPWRELRKPLFDSLIEQCEQEYDQSGPGQGFSEKVAWLVEQNLNRDLLLEDVAERLRISPRGLTRRLAAENNSFRKIVNRVRMEVACVHLESSRLSHEVLADTLGFSCAASLRRAIKIWQEQPKPGSH